MFCGCYSLKHIPDISKWNINIFIGLEIVHLNGERNGKIKLKEVKIINDMSYIFCECNQLISLPDISKWNSNNVTNMSYMFYKCKSLITLPDISKWNINNVTNMSYMFYGCNSLESFPDISNCKINNVADVNNIFCGCYSLK